MAAPIHAEIASIEASPDVNQIRPITESQYLVRQPSQSLLVSTQKIVAIPRHGGPTWTWSLTSVQAEDDLNLNKGTGASVAKRNNELTIDRGPIEERYVIHPSTVEQQFIIRNPLDHHQGASLIIEGKIRCEGELNKTTTGWTWFNDHGSIHLGDVFVFDANGQVIPADMFVTSSGSRIVVDGAALESAAYPVTIDPVIGSNDVRISDMGTDGITTRAAFSSAVAYNSVNNEYFVVWEGDDNVDGDNEIFGQRIDATTGAEIGTDIRLSDMGVENSGSYDALNPAIVYNATANEYLIVWESDDNTSGVGDGQNEIWGQRVDAATGVEVGTNDFRISDMGPDGNGAYDAFAPAIAWNSTGNEYLVVWHGDDNTAPLVSNEMEIHGQLLDATGAEIGSDFRVSDMGDDSETSAGVRDNFVANNAAVAYNSTDNEYLVVWDGDDDTAPLVDNENEIFGQRVSNVGAELGTDFRISDMGPDSSGNYDAYRPSITYNSTGNEYLVVWDADDTSGTLVNGKSAILGQRLSGAGAEVGTNDFRISNLGPAGNQNYDSFNPWVAYNAVQNEFLVVWDGEDDSGILANEEFEIYAQRISNAGASIDSNVRISDMGNDGDTAFDAKSPGVAFSTTAEQYLIVWEGDDNISPLVESENEIFSERFTTNNPPVAMDDPIGVSEDSMANALDVLANDTFAPDIGETLTIISVGTPDNGGSVSIVGGGASLEYTPVTDFFGIETFVYTIDDGKGSTDTAIVTITVGNVNDDPDAVNNSFTVDEDSTGNALDVLTNDTELPDTGETLTITGTGATDNGGSVAIIGGTSLQYTPAADFFGVEIFTYDIDDGNGGSDTATVSVTVTNSNDNPDAIDDSPAVAEDSVNMTLDVLANDTSAPDPAETLTIVGTGPPNNGGSISIQGGGSSLLYSPLPNFFGTETFTYTIVDENGGIDTASVDVSVTSSNDPPTAGDDVYSLSEDSTNNSLAVLSNDTIAPDVGESLTITAVDPGSAGGTVSIVGGGTSLVYTPVADFTGVETFTYTIDDGNTGIDIGSVSVTVVNLNDLPDAVDDSYVASEDSINNPHNVLSNDDIFPDTGEVLQIISTSAPSAGGTAVVSGGGSSILYTPAPDFVGNENYTYTIVDGNGGIDSATVNIVVNNVNDNPDAANDFFNVTEDSTGNLFLVLSNDTAAPDTGETLSISSVSPTIAGGIVTITSGNTIISYTPPADYFGSDSFTYTIEDGNGGGDSASVTISVSNNNDPPSASDDTFSATEDSIGNVLSVLGNDTFAPDTGESLSIVGVTVPDSSGTAAILGGGASILYEPAANFFGVETFSYTVSDGNGGLDTGQVSVTVNNTNDAPSAIDDTFTVVEDSTANALAATSNDLFTPDSGETITITALGTPSAGGSVSIAPGNADVLYSPAADYFGAEVFTYTITDGNGGFDVGTIVVTVTNVNDPPTVIDDTFTVEEDNTGTVFSVLVNDSSAPDTGESLSIQSLSATTNGGAASIVGGGSSVLYAPAPDFFGTDSFNYTASDGNGGETTGTVTVTVNNVNDDPSAVDDAFTIDEDTTTNVFAVLNNDTFAPDATETITITSVGAANSGGSVAIAPGNTSVTYTPPADYFGEDAFSYDISDGNGGSATAVVTVTVSNLNDLPTVVDDAYTLDEDTINNILPLLNNDSSAPDGPETLTLDSVGTPDSDGAAVIAGNGLEVNYTPAPDFFGVETFTYTVSDGNGGLAQGTATITVTDVNDDPNPSPDTFTVDTNSLANDFDVLVNDTAAPDVGESLTIIGVDSITQGGSLSVVDSGTRIRYTPAPDFAGDETFIYEVIDGRGGLAEATVTVTVVNTSAPPLIVVDTLLDEDNGNLDPGNFSLREAITRVAEGGTIQFAASLLNSKTDKTILLDSTLGPLLIEKDITVEGPGALVLGISGGGAIRVFEIDDSQETTIEVQLRNLTITGGYALNAPLTEGGCILNREKLVLTSCIVSAGQANTGGAINNRGELELHACNIGSNSNATFGGALANEPGATASFFDTVVQGARGVIGGGIANYGILRINQSTLTRNEASFDGGAIANFASLSIVNSTLSGNKSAENGGAILNGSGGSATIVHATIVYNTADSTVSSTGDAGGISNQSILAVDLRNSIVADNFDTPQNDGPGNIVPNLAGMYIGDQGNLIGNTAGSIGFGGSDINLAALAISDLSEILIADLTNNGGATPTHRLIPSGIAVDSALSDLATDPGTEIPLTVDQRGVGFGRLAFNASDIGAFELNALDDLDGDTIPDIIEGNADADDDGQANFIDTDSDADGIPDANEGAEDTDNDTIPNFLDLDSDGDTIPDQIEGEGDLDLDGVPNFLDEDSDGDRMPDAWEVANGLDPLVDDAFIDSDNDFAFNIEEFWGSGNPQDNTNLPGVTIGAVSPRAALAIGGTRILVEGSALLPGTRIFVNGVECIDAEYDQTRHAFRCTVPPHDTTESVTITADSPVNKLVVELEDALRYTYDPFDPALNTDPGIVHRWDDAEISTTYAYLPESGTLSLASSDGVIVDIPVSIANQPTFIVLTTARNFDTLHPNATPAFPEPDYGFYSPTVNIAGIVNTDDGQFDIDGTLLEPATLRLPVKGFPAEFGLSLASLEAVLDASLQPSLNTTTILLTDASWFNPDAEKNTLAFSIDTFGTYVGVSTCPGIDSNCDGSINAIDVQAFINATLGLTPGEVIDANDDGIVNAIDVQLAILSALGEF